MVAALVAAPLALSPIEASSAVETSTLYEAEDATLNRGVVEANHAGFTGRGFVNYDNVTGSYVQWTVSAPAAGPAQLGIRFANGTTTGRPMNIAVNGVVVAAGVASRRRVYGPPG